MSDKIRKSKAWSKAEDEKLMEMFRNDKTYKEIGAKLGRSYGSVTQRVHKLRCHEKPAAVKVAEKVLKQTEKVEPKKVKPLKMDKVIEDGRDALTHITRLVLYAEMLEKQNTALKARLAKIEKVLRD